MFPLLLLLLLTWLCPSCYSMMASPYTYSKYQPSHCADGIPTGLLRIHGGPGYHWEETAISGHTILTDENGCYVYAKLDLSSGTLISSGLFVGKDDPISDYNDDSDGGLVPMLRPTESAREMYCQMNHLCRYITQQQQQSQSQKPKTTSGTIKNLVLLLQFADHIDRLEHNPSQFNTLFNEPGGSISIARTGSVNDVFHTNSFGQLTIDSIVTPQWILLEEPFTEAYCSDTVSGTSNVIHDCIKAGLAQAESIMNLHHLFDNDENDEDEPSPPLLTIVHSGFAAEWGETDSHDIDYTHRIWSHQWSFLDHNDIPQPYELQDHPNMAFQDYAIVPAYWSTTGTSLSRIGVIVHEIGNLLSIPPLYDVDGSRGMGLGCYDFMANAWGCSGTQLHPPPLSAWTKLYMNWIEPQIIDSLNSQQEQEQDQQLTLRPSTSHPDAIKITAGFPSGEYLLIESRQHLWFDVKLEQPGLAIWHIDETASYNQEGYPNVDGTWPQNGYHYRISLLQADGEYDLERGFDYGDSSDLFHGQGINEIGPNGVFCSSGSDDGGSASSSQFIKSYPNTNAYQDGNLISTGIHIYDIGYVSPFTDDLTMILTIGRNTTAATTTGNTAGTTGSNMEEDIKEGLSKVESGPAAPSSEVSSSSSSQEIYDSSSNRRPPPPLPPQQEEEEEQQEEEIDNFGITEEEEEDVPLNDIENAGGGNPSTPNCLEAGSQCDPKNDGCCIGFTISHLTGDCVCV